MKATKTLLLTLGFFLIIGLSSCSEEEVLGDTINIPDKFSVDIPNAISNTNGGLSARISGDGDGIIEGDEIYAALPHFIRLGEASAEIVEVTLIIGAVLEQLNITSYEFTDETDDRMKRIDLTEDVIRGGVSYEFEMTMIDVEDGALALQLLWNSSNGVEGIGILQPFNINRIENLNNPEAFYQIEYSENDPDYEATMLVTISGIDLDEDASGTIEDDEKGNIDNLKMFVGKNGDIVEVRGNSNHPEITIIDQNFTGGRNYAFVGRGDETADIGVVNLWLPPSSLTTNSFVEGGVYSVFNVLDDEIKAVGFDDQDIIDGILVEAQSPAYFNSNGFMTSGADNRPEGFEVAFSNLSGMTPFVPVEVRDLAISFLQ